ncbi:MAG: hypothetical protein HFG54_06150 [Lachnospiraceae bacterium]|jgi:capsular polysaccharide biosynthesis protein|nr:hypothetical protein [Lachnospiraceae bacterium]
MDSLNTQTTYEQEIDLKDLIFAILYKWKIILITVIVFAVLLGGAKGFLTYKSQNDPNAVSQKEEAHQEELAQYESDLVSYEREIANISDNIINQQEYLENSILMNISPYDVCEARSDLFIKTDYEIMPGMAYQNVNYTDSILQAYQYIITSASFLEDINPSPEIDTHYLQELVSVKRGQLDSQASTANLSSLTNLLSIYVQHSDQEESEKILNAILDQLNTLHQQVAKDIGEHTVKILNTSADHIIDFSLSEKQATNFKRLDMLQTSLAEKKTALQELTKPANVTSPSSAFIKSTVKYGVLGGVLGGFLIVFFICVCFLLSDKLYSPKELRNRFGAKILGTLTIAASSKKSSIDQWLSHLEGRSRNSTADEYELITANIKNYTNNIKTLLVSGCAASDSIIQVTDYLKDRLPNVQVITGGNILQNVDAIQKLSECDSVVFVEQCNYSSYHSIELELEKAYDLKKEIVGFIVFE